MSVYWTYLHPEPIVSMCVFIHDHSISKTPKRNKLQLLSMHKTVQNLNHCQNPLHLIVRHGQSNVVVVALGFVVAGQADLGHSLPCLVSQEVVHVE